MCLRTKLVAGLFGVCLAADAYAQVVASGLDDVSPWAIDFVGEDETKLSSTLWTASDPDTLLALMRRTRTRNLTPGEQMLLRQLVFSSGDAPDIDQSNELMAERARILLEIGEADAAATLFPLLSDTVGELEPEEIAIDLLVGLGNEESACAASESEAREGAFWAKLRATCFALDDNGSAAELALELAISEGVDDPWFYEAVFAAVGIAPETPTARYDSGIALALSKKAGLPVPSDAIANSRADLSAAIAVSSDLEPSLRVQAAGTSAEMGLIGATEHRDAYQALLDLESFEPRTPLEIAIAANWVGEEAVDTKARTLNAALSTAQGSAARYHAVSRLLQDDINSLPKSQVTARYSLAFARANLAADDLISSEEWLEAFSQSESGGENPFDIAWMLGLIRLADGALVPDAEDNLGTQLAELADTPAKRSAMRRLLVLWSAFDLPLGPTAREALTADPNEEGEPVFPMLLRSINAAADEGAAAESALQTLKLTSGDPSTVRASDMSQLLEALQVVGASNAARQLALESTGFWKREL